MLVSNSHLNEILVKVSTMTNRSSAQKKAWFDEFIMITFDPEKAILSFMSANARMQSHYDLPVLASKDDTEPFTVCISPFIMLEHVRKTNNSIDISHKDGKLIMKFGRGKSQMKTHNEYIDPFLARDDSEHTFFNGIEYSTITIDSAEFKNIMKSLVHILSSGDGNMQLGIFKSDGEAMYIAATDGFRACRYSRFAKVLDAKVFDISLHVDAISKIAAVLDDENKDIKVVFRPDKISIVDGEYRAHFLTSGEGRDIWSVLDDALIRTNKTMVIKDLDKFRKAVKFIATFSRGDGKYGNDVPMVMKFYDKTLFLSCTVQEKGDTEWEIDITRDLDDTITVGVNPSYLHQYLTNIKPTSLDMKVSEPNKPIRLDGDRIDVEYVLMPILLNASLSQ